MPGNIHTVPASVIESWPKPNYVDPIRRTWLPAFSLTFMTFTTILIAGRFWLRLRKQAGSFGLDDAFIFAAWIFAVAETVFACVDSIYYGIDRHTWDVPLDEYVGAAFIGWIAQVLMLLSTCATKVSVLMFYRRMVTDTYSKRWKYAIWAAIGFTAAYCIGVFLAYILVCQPTDSYWLSYDFSYKGHYHCASAAGMNPAIGVLSVVSDLYAVILPMIMLNHYNLQVPRRQKIGLNVIFALGFLVAGAGIARTYYLIQLRNNYDTSWTGFDLYVWSILECQLAIICASAPSLRAFFRRYLSGPINRTIRSASRSVSNQQSNKGTRETSTLPTQQLSSIHTPQSLAEKGLTKYSTESEEREMTSAGGTSSVRTQSSDAQPRFKSAEDYEAFALKELNRHAFKRTDTHGSIGFEGDIGQYPRHIDVEHPV